MFGIRRKVTEFGYGILNRIDPPFFRQLHAYADLVVREPEFERLYEEGRKRSGARESIWRRDRFYNLFGVLDLAARIPEGDIAECGSFLGHSSYMLCRRLQAHDPSFDGKGYHIFDSFEGLSAPIAEDGVAKEAKGMMAATLEHVRGTLKDFPKITYHKGWIPEVFKTTEERKYRLIHIDVDLVEPTVGSMEYFLPRMVPGGMMVCDDYASVRWPGTKPAVDAFVKKNGLRSLAVSAGQIILFI